MSALSISTRLLLSYLLVAVLPLAGLAAVYLASFESSLRETLLANMATIADKKASQIDSYISERRDETLQLSRRNAIRGGLVEIARAYQTGGSDAAAYRDATSRLRAILEESSTAEGYYDLLLIDTAGNVLFSLREEADLGTNLLQGPYRDTQLAQGYTQAMRAGALQLSRFAQYSPSGNRPAAFLVTPVASGGKTVGALALQLDLRKLMAVTTDRIGLGETGETVLAQKDANAAFYTVPLRHVLDAAYRYRVPLGEAAQPMQQALAGSAGTGIVRDYAGIECIAAWRPLPSLDWGMVVKIDTAEAFAPAARMRRYTYLALGLFLLLSGAAAYLLGRTISRPIGTLTEVADRIAAGDLGQRAPEAGSGELGRLARAFNHMADALADSRQNLEAEVEARSQELRAVTTLQEAILAQAGALIVVLDRSGRIRRFNRACEALTQYRFDEVEGKFVWDLFLTPEEREKVHAEAFQALARNPQAPRGSYTNYWVARDGTRRLVEWSNTLLLDARGEMEFMVGIGIDVTEKKHAEAALQESAQRLNEAQRIAQVGSWELDIASGSLTWSDEIFRIFELDKTSFAASYEAFLQAIHPDDRERVHHAYGDSLENCSPYEIVHRLLMPDGRIKWVSERCETHYDAQGKPIRSTGTVQDITARKQSEEALRLYASVFEHSGESILIIDRGRRIVAANSAFTRMTGYSLDDVRGRGPDLLASGQAAETYRAMWEALGTSGYWQGEIPGQRKDGSLYPTWVSVSVVRDPDGRITHYLTSFTDISERKQAEAKISQLAYHDALTGLVNRFSLQGQLEQALAMTRREERALAVIFLDLDRFKSINDTMGHAVGDQLLIEVARRLHDSVRESDIVARLGGDEFVVVLTEVDGAHTAARVADKILQAVARTYHIAGNELHSTASLGLAFFPGDGEDGETLMKNADTAMYHAKSLGRNNVQFFTAEMNAAAVKRLMLDHDLRIALENRQFELHYQPQLDSRDGRTVGVEALVRWRHPRDGLVAPAEFIPLAEENGLILPLGEWVLDEACRQLHAWHDQGIRDVTMAVNLSARQLHSPQLLAHVSQALTRHGLAGTDLELEVTESVAMHDPDASIRQLRALRDLGVRLSIDDFGTGYSSLSYLKLLPIHTLKLDQSFVRDIETDSNDVAICTATIALAHSLGLAVIAEGVETEAQRMLLASHHCDFMQGYLFSRPLPAEAALDFMRRRQAA